VPRIALPIWLVKFTIPSHIRYVNPDAALLSRAAKALDNFKDCFPLVKSEAKERTMKKRFWSDAFAAAADITLDSYVGADAKRQKGDDNEKMSLQVRLGVIFSMRMQDTYNVLSTVCFGWKCG